MQSAIKKWKNRIIIKNGNLDATEVNKNFGISIRILKDGFLGFVATNDLKFPKLKQHVNKALKLAKHSKNILKKPMKLSEEKAFRDKYIVKQKIKLQNISLEKKIKKIDTEVMPLAQPLLVVVSGLHLFLKCDKQLLPLSISTAI